MARKKKRRSSYQKRWYNWTITTKNLTSRRNLNKYRRSPTYWQQHNDLVFSKILLYDVEKIWLELNTPEAKIEFKQVENPTRFARYRAGLWDGMAYFVTFKTTRDSSKFKLAMWSRPRRRG